MLEAVARAGRGDDDALAFRMRVDNEAEIRRDGVETSRRFRTARADTAQVWPHQVGHRNLLLRRDLAIDGRRRCGGGEAFAGYLDCAGAIQRGEAVKPAF